MANKKSPNGVQGMVERLLNEPCNQRLRNKVNHYVRNTDVFKCVVTSSKSNHNDKYEFQRSGQTDNLFCNVLQLDQLFGKPKVVEGIISGSLSRDELGKELMDVETELRSRFDSYAYWMNRLEGLKAVLLGEPKEFFSEQRLSEALQVSPYQDHHGKELPFALRAVRHLEQLEERGRLTNPTASGLAEKADALVRLGALDLADRYAQEALAQDAGCSSAWVVRIMVALKLRDEAIRENQHYGFMNEGVGTPLTSEEHWAEERQDEALEKAAKQYATLGKILPGAIVHWPKVNTYAYQQEEMFRVARNLLITTLFKKVHPETAQSSRNLASLYQANGMEPEYQLWGSKVFHSFNFGHENVDDHFSPFDGIERQALQIVLKDRDRRLEDHYEFYGFWNKDSLALDLQLLHLRLVLDDGGYARHRKTFLEWVNSGLPDRVDEALLQPHRIGKLLVLHQLQMGNSQQGQEFIQTWRDHQLNEHQSRVSAKEFNYLRWLYHHQYARGEFVSCMRICDQADQVIVPTTDSIHRNWLDEAQPCLINKKFWAYLRVRAAVDLVLAKPDQVSEEVAASLLMSDPVLYFKEESLYCKEIPDYDSGDVYFEPFYGDSLLTSGEWEEALARVASEGVFSEQDSAIVGRMIVELRAARDAAELSLSQPWFEVHALNQTDKPK